MYLPLYACKGQCDLFLVGETIYHWVCKWNLFGSRHFHKVPGQKVKELCLVFIRSQEAFSAVLATPGFSMFMTADQSSIWISLSGVLLVLFSRQIAL